MKDLIGHEFGHYRITALVGQGGMALVYKAYQPSMDRHVAIKVLPPYFTHDPDFAGRFHQEVRVIAKLQHPYILPVYDCGTINDYAYLVMRLVESGTLADRYQKGPLPLAQIQQVAAQVGSALDYAHSLSIVHRDVKPSNILIDDQDNCLLTDFGIAKIMASSTVLTRTGATVGTPSYMSPEQIRGESVDGRSDLYSLGIILYEMATGRAPYEGDTPSAVFVKHLLEPLPPPRSYNPEITPDVEAVLHRALAKEPRDRYQTAAELTDALGRALAPGSADGRPPTEGSVPATVPRRKPTVKAAEVARPRGALWYASLLGILLLLVGGGMGAWAWVGGGGPLAPLLAPAPTETPTMMATVVMAPTETPTTRPSPTATATASATRVRPTATETATPTRRATPTSVRATPTPRATSTPVPTHTPTRAAPSVVVPVPVAPQAGADVPTAAAFSWTGRLSAGQAYMVHLIHVATQWTLTSPPLGTTAWTVELPAERYGEWHWQVRVVSGGATVAESASIHFYLVPLPGHAGPGATATPLPYPYPTSPYPTPTPYPYPYP